MRAGPLDLRLHSTTTMQFCFLLVLTFIDTSRKLSGKITRFGRDFCLRFFKDCPPWSGIIQGFNKSVEAFDQFTILEVLATKYGVLLGKDFQVGQALVTFGFGMVFVRGLQFGDQLGLIKKTYFAINFRSIILAKTLHWASWSWISNAKKLTNDELCFEYFCKFALINGAISYRKKVF